MELISLTNTLAHGVLISGAREGRTAEAKSSGKREGIEQCTLERLALTGGQELIYCSRRESRLWAEPVRWIGVVEFN